MEDKKPLLLLWILALGGFIPFAILAFAALQGLDLPLPLPILTLFTVWSIAILTFLGGIRWGMAILSEPVGKLDLILSVIPCIIAWFAFFAPEGVTVLVLGVLFLLQGGWDAVTYSGKGLSWFVPIRLVLTLLVCSAHAVVFSLYI